MPRVWNQPLKNLQQSFNDRRALRERVLGAPDPVAAPTSGLIALDSRVLWTDGTGTAISSFSIADYGSISINVDNYEYIDSAVTYTVPSQVYPAPSWSWQTEWQTNTNDFQIFTGGTDLMYHPAEPISEEEADRRLAATRALAHKNAVRRNRALKRGRKLLLAVLTEAQQRDYARHKSFTVQGADGKTYVLRKGGTTHELDGYGRATFSHCIHLPYSYIDEDTLVALKLLLETDASEFRRIANTSRIAVPELPALWTDRTQALAAGFDAVNQRFAHLAEAAVQARRSMDRLGRAIDYASYARELEAQVVAEEAGLALPLAARQYRAAQALGHAETIAGEPVAALAAN